MLQAKGRVIGGKTGALLLELRGLDYRGSRAKAVDSGFLRPDKGSKALPAGDLGIGKIDQFHDSFSCFIKKAARMQAALQSQYRAFKIIYLPPGLPI